MKAGDVFTAHTPDDKHIHGHKFELLRQEDRLYPATGETSRVWVSRDLDTGEERAWVDAHFEAALKPSKK